MDHWLLGGTIYYYVQSNYPWKTESTAVTMFQAATRTKDYSIFTLFYVSGYDTTLQFATIEPYTHLSKTIFTEPIYFLVNLGYIFVLDRLQPQQRRK